MSFLFVPPVHRRPARHRWQRRRRDAWIVSSGGGGGGNPSPTWMEPARGIVWTELARSATWAEADRALTWSTPMSTLVKRAGETRLYTMDFSNLPEISGGDTVASVTLIACSAVVSGPGATSDLTLSSKAVTANSKGLQCKIAGGTDLTTYKLLFIGLTAAGYTLVGVGYLYVDDA